MELIARVRGSAAKERVDAVAVRAVKFPGEGSACYQAQTEDGVWHCFTKKDNPSFKMMLKRDDTWSADLVTHDCGIRYRHAMYKYTSPTIGLKGAA